MKVLDLCAGSGSSTQAFKDRGHDVVTLDCEYEADINTNVRDFHTSEYFDVIWASPPCTTFSVASCYRHWKNGKPASQACLEGIEILENVIRIIHEVTPRYWFLENPRGMMRKQRILKPYHRATITYCQYGDTRQKPTDIWGVFPRSLIWKPPCKPAAPCHEPSPRGTTGGTQGMTGAFERSKVPYGLSLSICQALEIAFDAGIEPCHSQTQILAKW